MPARPMTGNSRLRFGGRKWKMALSTCRKMLLISPLPRITISLKLSNITSTIKIDKYIVLMINIKDKFIVLLISKISFKIYFFLILKSED